MSLAAGRLRDRVTLQRQVATQDQQKGSIKTTWVTVVEHIPAEIAALSAREFVSAGATQAEVTARVTMRYRTDVLASMRLLDERTGLIYGIIGVLPDAKSGREYLTLPVKEGVSDGR